MGIPPAICMETDGLASLGVHMPWMHTRWVPLPMSSKCQPPLHQRAERRP